MNDIQSPYHVRAATDNVDTRALEVLNKLIYEWILDTPEGPVRFDGKLIGFGSSRRHEHNHGNVFSNNTNPEPSRRCAACRWTEIRIFDTFVKVTDTVDTRGRYLVHTLGPSLIPGETTLARVQWCQGAFEIIEAATVRKSTNAAPFIPAAYARALAMASSFSDDVADAYVNRAVA